MKTDSGQPAAAGGRKSAYVARNRIKILLAAQQVMAEHGLECTVEAVSEKADIAVSTIYKHFETRDSLFQEALIVAFRDWEDWALRQIPQGATDLEHFVFPARLLMHIPETHPTYAKLIASQPGIGLKVITTITVQMNAVALKLAKAGLLKTDALEIRLRNLQGAMLQAIEHRLANPSSAVADAEKALEIALTMIGLTASQSKKLCTESLELKL